MQSKRILEKIKIRNFKSIREQTLNLAPLNVFIGGNGSGKSNLVGVFFFLNRLVSEKLQTYIGISGGADKILHFGRRMSPSLSVALQFSSGPHANGYSFELVPADEDTFVFSEEKIWFHDRVRFKGRKPYDVYLGEGHREAKLAKLAKSGDPIAGYVLSDLQSYRIYHFHDTSREARVKQTCDIEDNKFLRPDAGNLAAFLYLLQRRHREHFQNIEDTVRQIAPFFGGFRLDPSRQNTDKIRLEWIEKGCDSYFNAQALSDGTLRFICLATLLLQPELPAVILLDEPELGLHPAAIALLAALLESAALRTQILAATQSVTLVNHFTPDRVWVVEREGGESVFRHLAQGDLSTWLDGYALGELWEKNVLGGRP